MRTNAFVTDVTGEKVPVLVKPFSFMGGACWTYPEYRSKGVLRIYPETKEVEVLIHKGCHPVASELIDFLFRDKDVRQLVYAYQQSTRKHPYTVSVRVGMSGCCDTYINYLDETGLEISGKKLLHITCANKMSGIRKIYIGDLVEAFFGLLSNGGFIYNVYNSSFRYEKPYFHNGSTKVNKLYIR